MISFYSGTPGSGKSLKMAHDVVNWLKSFKKNVIANVEIDRDFILKGKPGGQFFYLSNDEFSPDYFYEYAIKNHVIGKEHQTLIVVDEAQTIFSPSAVKLFTQINPKYRQEWLDFFTQHRHLGYDIILISQFDRLIDPQIRCLFEYNYVHRKANNFGVIGQILSILHIPLFVQVQKWYGMNEVCGKSFYTYRKKYAKIYNSYAFREKVIEILTKKYGKEKMAELMGFRINKVKEKVS